MNMEAIFNIRPGVTSVIGGGGKTTLLTALAEELRGTVILCTTTKIFPSAVYPTLIGPDSAEIAGALADHRVICIGSQAQFGKLAQPKQSFRELCALADFVLVEADGAKHLPLKAHGPHEPVVPAESNQVIYVLGADGFGRPIRDVCHRQELYSTLCDASPDTPVTPELAARVLQAEGLGDLFFINKTEQPQDCQNARQLSALLDCPVVFGSLHRRKFTCLP